MRKQNFTFSCNPLSSSWISFEIQSTVLHSFVADKIKKQLFLAFKLRLKCSQEGIEREKNANIIFIAISYYFPRLYVMLFCCCCCYLLQRREKCLYLNIYIFFPPQRWRLMAHWWKKFSSSLAEFFF